MVSQLYRMPQKNYHLLIFLSVFFPFHFSTLSSYIFTITSSTSFYTALKRIKVFIQWSVKNFKVYLLRVMRRQCVSYECKLRLARK